MKQQENGGVSEKLVGQGEAESQSSDSKNTCSQGSLRQRTQLDWIAGKQGKQLRFQSMLGDESDDARCPLIARLSACVPCRLQVDFAAALSHSDRWPASTFFDGDEM